MNAGIQTFSAASFALRTLSICIFLTVWLGCRDSSSGETRGSVEKALSSEGATKLTAPSLRIVSLAPVATEICYALGAGEQLVGRTRFCEYPAAVQAIEIVGDASSVSMEHLGRLQPDLVITCGNSIGVQEKLAAMNIPALQLPDASLDDLYLAIRSVGNALHCAERADDLCAQIQSDLRDVSRAFTGLPTHRVLMTIGRISQPPRPVFAAASGSFYDDLLRIGGQINALPADAKAFAPWSFEAILRADPEIILEFAAEIPPTEVHHASRESLERWEQIGAIRAVKNGDVRVIGGRNHFLLGPRVAETLRAILQAIRDCDEESE